MTLHDQTPPSKRPGPVPASNVVALAQACQHINSRRAALDHELLSLPEQDPRREEIWAALDAVADDFVAAVGRLAQAAAMDAGDLRQKAAVLAVLLRAGIDITLPEVSALALSVAEDVAHVT